MYCDCDYESENGWNGIKIGLADFLDAEPKLVWKRAGLAVLKPNVLYIELYVKCDITLQKPTQRLLIWSSISFSGDLWSYDREQKNYIVSPDPHIEVIDLEKDVDCFMILASDGLWGVMDAQEAINIVDDYEKEDPQNTDAATK